MKLIVLTAIVVLLLTGCIEQKVGDVKESNIQANQTETGAVKDIEPTETEPAETAAQTPEQTPAQTPAQTSPSPEEVNDTTDESIAPIRNAIKEALEKSSSRV